MYRLLFRVLLSRLDPERAHTLAYGVIRRLPIVGIGALVRQFTRPDAALAVTTLGLRFDSPFGIAAGFDKEGTAIRGLGQLGFGHVEVGTITAHAQPGNEKPRLFRLIADRAVINRMGFNNHGAAAAAAVIAPERARRLRPVIGVTFAQRWQNNRNDIQPVIKILAEASAFDFTHQIAVGGSDDTHIHFDRLGTTDAFKFALLQHT